MTDQVQLLFGILVIYALAATAMCCLLGWAYRDVMRGWHATILLARDYEAQLNEMCSERPQSHEAVAS